MIARDVNSSLAFGYRDSTIEILCRHSRDEIKVNETKIQSFRVADSDAYVCDELPYRVFSSLEELGMAFVDLGLSG